MPPRVGDVPAGRYAISEPHDEKKLDCDFIGIPKVGCHFAAEQSPASSHSDGM